jgi:hypothetical protein
MMIRGIDCSSIPANVYIVMWNGSQTSDKGDTGFGEILHNDRPALRERFDDPSPYLSILNQHLLACVDLQLGVEAKAGDVTCAAPPPAQKPPLTVAQAQAIKTQLIDALFNNKQQAPITFSGK